MPKSLGQKLRTTWAAHAALFECADVQAPPRSASPSLEARMAAADISVDAALAASTVDTEYKLTFKADTSLLFAQRVLLTLYADGIMRSSQMPTPLQSAFSVINRLEESSQTEDFVPDILRSYEVLCAENDQLYLEAGGPPALEKFSKKCGAPSSIQAVLATLQNLQFHPTDGVRNGTLPAPGNKLKAFSDLFLNAMKKIGWFNVHAHRQITAQHLVEALHEYHHPVFGPAEEGAEEEADGPTLVEFFKGFFETHPDQEWLDAIPEALGPQADFGLTEKSINKFLRMNTWAKGKYNRASPTPGDATRVGQFESLHKDWLLQKGHHTTTIWWDAFKSNLAAQWLGMGKMGAAQKFAALHTGLTRSGFIGPQPQETLEGAQKMIQTMGRYLEGLQLFMGGTIPVIVRPFYELMAQPTPHDLVGCNHRIKRMAAGWDKLQELSWNNALNSAVNQGYIVGRTIYHVQNMGGITAEMATPDKLVSSADAWGRDMRAACTKAIVSASAV